MFEIPIVMQSGPGVEKEGKSCTVPKPMKVTVVADT